MSLKSREGFEVLVYLGSKKRSVLNSIKNSL